MLRFMKMYIYVLCVNVNVCPLPQTQDVWKWNLFKHCRPCLAFNRKYKSMKTTNALDQKLNKEKINMYP